MALPLIPIAAALAHGTTQILTKPWPWILIGGWLAVTQIQWRVVSEEVRATFSSLWWVVILFVIAPIIGGAIQALIAERGKTKRDQNRTRQK